MTSKPRWLYDELKHAGVDYNDPAQVAVYDSRHQKFRDYKKNTEAIIDTLKIGPEHTLLDMGAGTGAFSLYAAPYCKTIYAVDVSPVMLDYARRKAEEARVRNIVFCQGGFLTYEHQYPVVDAVISIAVLHHLPDFWKLIALRRIAGMLKPGGRFFLFDVVFPSEINNYEVQLNGLVSSMTQLVGKEFAVEIETHLREEYSTFDWVLEGMLKRIGFRIDSMTSTKDFHATYLCTLM